MSRIELRNIDKRYGDGTLAVRDVSMQVDDGEFLVFVGPSGCGKSTLLRMIAGLERITAGEIEIGGRVVNGIPPKQRDIAMVFQNYALYPHMTVRDNIGFGLKLAKVPKPERRERIHRTAEVLALTDLLDRKPDALSGGQRQRVAMGRAIVREPVAYLMDEPLSNLDAKLREQMRTELAGLHERLATTTIYVTHDQVEAMTLGMRVAVLAPVGDVEGSNLQQIAAPRELYERPANVFVASFIGSPSMNLTSARVERDAQEVRLRFGGQELSVGHQHPLAKAILASGLDTLTMGYRPDDFRPDNAAARLLTPRAELVEDRGVDTYVHFFIEPGHSVADLAKVDPDQTRWVARVPTVDAPEVGDTFSLGIDLDRVHLFDPTSKQRID